MAKKKAKKKKPAKKKANKKTAKKKAKKKVTKKKRFLTSEKMFNMSEGEMQDYQKKTLDILQRVDLQAAKTGRARTMGVFEIKEALADFLCHVIGGDKRKFGINFLDEYTNDMTIEELLSALKKIDTGSLVCILKAVCRELKKDRAVSFISTRDALGDVEKTVEDKCKGCFSKAGLLEAHLHHLKDQEKYKAPRFAKPPLYAGVDPSIASDNALFEQMREAQEQMKIVGHKTERQKCSKTHIVMSAAIGKGWVADSDDRFMVITARNTDKTNLLIPSHTPVVEQVEGNLIYYGDSTAEPSSELRSHWAMHEKLSGMGAEWSGLRSIFHAHLIDMVKLSRQCPNESELVLGNSLVPIIDWCLLGEPKLGEEIVTRMVECKSHMAIVKEHGPWFVARSTNEAFDLAMALVDTVRGANEL